MTVRPTPIPMDLGGTHHGKELHYHLPDGRPTNLVRWACTCGARGEPTTDRQAAEDGWWHHLGDIRRGIAKNN